MSITEKMTKNTTSESWKGEIPVHYLYTYGIANEDFFRSVKDKGTFVGTKCDKCNVTYVPPKIFCERCMAELEKYTDVGTTGTVESFTVCYEGADGKRLNQPRVITFVKIDNTDGGLVHEFGGSPDQIKIGMKVTAEFKPESEREGALTDIVCFK